jgi:hypothetical protein
MNKKDSPLDKLAVQDKAVLEAMIRCGETNAHIAREFGTSEAAIRRYRKRHGIQVQRGEQAYTRVTGDTAEASTGRTTQAPVLDDPDAMLRQRGLQPEEWYIDSITCNEWGGAEKQYQTKFIAKRKVALGLVRPARADGWRVDEVKRMTTRHLATDPDEPRTIVIVGDQQAPFHDEHLDTLFRAWLYHNEPDEGVLLGDTIDLPDISRHPFDPDSNATVNQCIQSGYDILRGYVAASEGTAWVKLIGNHDTRLREFVLKQAKELYGVRRATRPGEEGESSVLSVEHLLRLDELGIDLVDPHGPYDQGHYTLSPHLAVRHGWLAQKGGGKTALASLEHLGYSIVVGHTHRQSLVQKTGHDIGGNIFTLVGVEAGCMCVVQRTEKEGRYWPNYAVNPDWQQGFAVATIWPDGKFRIDLATYVNNVLLYRDQRYE